ncbi:MAG: 3'(2'),5'-bisphosphate nucleotidase CysQ [Paracoccaceae bacterium]
MSQADDLALLTEAAHAAGDIARKYWRQDPQVWEKGEGAGPVTEADLAIDRMLSETLRRARPDYGWLSEETEDDAARLNHDRVFITDPIDGTRAFVAGEKGFAHALAVADGGRITAAVVYLPLLDLLYAATADGPATCNGSPIAPSAHADAEGARLYANSSALGAQHWSGPVPIFERMFNASLAWRMCRVADGSADAVLSFGKVWEWDSAAASLILSAAGAKVTDCTGATLAFNAVYPRSNGVLAANPSLHGAMRTRLAA